MLPCVVVSGGRLSAQLVVDGTGVLKAKRRKTASLSVDGYRRAVENCRLPEIRGRGVLTGVACLSTNPGVWPITVPRHGPAF